MADEVRMAESQAGPIWRDQEWQSYISDFTPTNFAASRSDDEKQDEEITLSEILRRVFDKIAEQSTDKDTVQPIHQSVNDACRLDDLLTSCGKPGSNHATFIDVISQLTEQTRALQSDRPPVIAIGSVMAKRKPSQDYGQDLRSPIIYVMNRTDTETAQVNRGKDTEKDEIESETETTPSTETAQVNRGKDAEKDEKESETETTPSYTLTVFNCGAGVDIYHDCKTQNGSVLYCNAIQIPIAQKLAESTALWWALLQIKFYAVRNLKDEAVLYECILPYLSGQKSFTPKMFKPVGGYSSMSLAPAAVVTVLIEHLLGGAYQGNVHDHVPLMRHTMFMMRRTMLDKLQHDLQEASTKSGAEWSIEQSDLLMMKTFLVVMARSSAALLKSNSGCEDLVKSVATTVQTIKTKLVSLENEAGAGVSIGSNRFAPLKVQPVVQVSGFYGFDLLSNSTSDDIFSGGTVSAAADNMLNLIDDVDEVSPFDSFLQSLRSCEDHCTKLRSSNAPSFTSANQVAALVEAFFTQVSLPTRCAPEKPGTEWWHRENLDDLKVTVYGAAVMGYLEYIAKQYFAAVLTAINPNTDKLSTAHNSVTLGAIFVVFDFIFRRMQESYRAHEKGEPKPVFFRALESAFLDKEIGLCFDTLRGGRFDEVLAAMTVSAPHFLGTRRAVSKYWAEYKTQKQLFDFTVESNSQEVAFKLKEGKCPTLKLMSQLLICCGIKMNAPVPTPDHAVKCGEMNSEDESSLQNDEKCIKWIRVDLADAPLFQLTRNMTLLFRLSLEDLLFYGSNSSGTQILSDDVVPHLIFTSERTTGALLKCIPLFTKLEGSDRGGLSLPSRVNLHTFTLPELLIWTMMSPNEKKRAERRAASDGLATEETAPLEEEDVINPHQGSQNLPDFNVTLSDEESERLLTYLTVPHLAIPLVLKFFSDSVSSLLNPELSWILWQVMFQTGPTPTASDEGASTLVPAPAAIRATVLAVEGGMLMNLLHHQPSSVLRPLMELAANAHILGETSNYRSPFVKLYLYIVRVVRNVQLFLLDMNARTGEVDPEQIDQLETWLTRKARFIVCKWRAQAESDCAEAQICYFQIFMVLIHGVALRRWCCTSLLNSEKDVKKGCLFIQNFLTSTAYVVLRQSAVQTGEDMRTGEAKDNILQDLPLREVYEEMQWARQPIVCWLQKILGYSKTSRARLNGTYDINYDDGEWEMGVDRDLIRGKGDQESSKKFEEGDKIEVDYKGKGKYHPGKISRCRASESPKSQKAIAMAQLCVSKMLDTVADVTLKNVPIGHNETGAGQDAAQASGVEKTRDAWKPLFVLPILSSCTVEIQHPYAPRSKLVQTVSFPRARYISVSFDNLTKLSADDSVVFYKDLSCTEYFSVRYNGSSSWPGTAGRHPLLIPADSFVVVFEAGIQTKGEDYGFKFEAQAPVSEGLAIALRRQTIKLRILADGRPLSLFTCKRVLANTQCCEKSALAELSAQAEEQEANSRIEFDSRKRSMVLSMYRRYDGIQLNLQTGQVYLNDTTLVPPPIDISRTGEYRHLFAFGQEVEQSLLCSITEKTELRECIELTMDDQRYHIGAWKAITAKNKQQISAHHNRVRLQKQLQVFQRHVSSASTKISESPDVYEADDMAVNSLNLGGWDLIDGVNFPRQGTQRRLSLFGHDYDFQADFTRSSEQQEPGGSDGKDANELDEPTCNYSRPQEFFRQILAQKCELKDLSHSLRPYVWLPAQSQSGSKTSHRDTRGARQTHAVAVMYVRSHRSQTHPGLFHEVRAVGAHQQAIEVFCLVPHGRRLVRTLVYASDRRLCLGLCNPSDSHSYKTRQGGLGSITKSFDVLHGETFKRKVAPIRGTDYSVGLFDLQLSPMQKSCVIVRTRNRKIVAREEERRKRRSHLQMTQTLLSRRSSAPSEESEDADMKEHDFEGQAQNQEQDEEDDSEDAVEEFIPSKSLIGLIPDAILANYKFWRTGKCTIRGYALSAIEDADVAHFKFINKNGGKTSMLPLKEAYTKKLNELKNSRWYDGTSIVLSLFHAPETNITAESEDSDARSVGWDSRSELGARSQITSIEHSSRYSSSDETPGLPLPLIRSVYAEVRREQDNGEGSLLLLNIATAADPDAELYHMRSILTDLVDAGQILVWSDSDAHEGEYAALHSIEIPLLRLKFSPERNQEGELFIASQEFPGKFVCDSVGRKSNPDYFTSATCKISANISHAIWLQDDYHNRFLLMPNCPLQRFATAGTPLGVQYVRIHSVRWLTQTKSRYYLYALHSSGAFVSAPTLAARLYLAYVYLTIRNYDAAIQCLNECSADRKFSSEERYIRDLFNVQSLIDETDSARSNLDMAHPDLLGCLLRVCVLCELSREKSPVELRIIYAAYLTRISDVSTACRLPLREEYELLTNFCTGNEKRLEYVRRVLVLEDPAAVSNVAGPPQQQAEVEPLKWAEIPNQITKWVKLFNASPPKFNDAKLNFYDVGSHDVVLRWRRAVSDFRSPTILYRVFARVWDDERRLEQVREQLNLREVHKSWELHKEEDGCDFHNPRESNAATSCLKHWQLKVECTKQNCCVLDHLVPGLQYIFLVVAMNEGGSSYILSKTLRMGEGGRKQEIDIPDVDEGPRALIIPRRDGLFLPIPPIRYHRPKNHSTDGSNPTEYLAEDAARLLFVTLQSCEYMLSNSWGGGRRGRKDSVFCTRF
jgi:hypothetical protein